MRKSVQVHLPWFDTYVEFGYLVYLANAHVSLTPFQCPVNEQPPVVISTAFTWPTDLSTLGARACVDARESSNYQPAGSRH